MVKVKKPSSKGRPKKPPYVRFTLSLPVDLYDKVKAESESQTRTISGQIEHVLRKEYKD
ncbi:TA system antitoxin ParD family protein [Leptospira levettii]|uniref:TA system antitoxin ParD family protein n=1 Tax=Leptospira levettii TaxID=2023178 RepID=UPI0038F6F6A0